MNYVESFNLFGTPAKEIPCIKGEGVPTKTTEGAIGCLYMNTLTGDMYKCVSIKKVILRAGSGYTTNWDEFSPARFKIPNVKVGDIVELRFDFSVNLDGVSDDVRTRVVTNDERILWPVFKQYNADGSIKAERIFELKNSTQGMINCAFTVGDPNEFYRIIIRSAVGLKDCWELSNFFAIPSYGGENIGSTTVGSTTVYDAPINLDFSDGLNYWLNVGTADNPKVVVEGGLPIWEGIADQTYSPESENAQSGKAVKEAVEHFEDVKYEILTADTLTWEQGSLYNGGALTPNTKCISTNFIKVFPMTTLLIDSDCNLRIQEYNSDKTFLKQSQDALTKMTSYTARGGGYIRITLSTDPNDVTPAMAHANEVKLTVKYEKFPFLEEQIYKVTTADNVEWIQGSISGGKWSPADNSISTDFIRASKGVINLQSDCTLRVTAYDINKNYLSNTGDYKKISSYSMNYDGYVRIGVRKLNSVLTPDMGNSNLVKFAIEYYLSERLNNLATQLENITDDIGDSFKETFEELNAKVENLMPITPETEEWGECGEFSSLFLNTGKVESFLWWSDAHWITNSGYEEEFKKSIVRLKKYYEATPTSFVINSGDNISHLEPIEACKRLGYLNAVTSSNFDRHYSIVGNHDYNMTQDGSNPEKELSSDTIRNLLLRDRDHTYYSFDGDNTRFYVLDSTSRWWFAPDYSSTMPAIITACNLMKEQIPWFANKLKEDDKVNSAIIIHATHDNRPFKEGETTPPLGECLLPFMKDILDICKAYNNKTSITLYGNTYNFADCKGTMRFVLAGHTHKDDVFVVNDIPVVILRTAQKGQSGASHSNDFPFDLCLVDYGSNTLKTVRVGTVGSDRTVGIYGNANVGLITE